MCCLVNLLEGNAIVLFRLYCVLSWYNFFLLMIRRPPRSTQSRSSAASDVYKIQFEDVLRCAKKNCEYWPKERTVEAVKIGQKVLVWGCLLYTSPSPRDRTRTRMPSSA